ncbi:hypothetical protein ACQPU1_10530 [Clostridium paraputrificum]|uniref:hypothetical protein n=1 Tax=Clostridium TaxID=1485 RepID=UPI003D34BDE6
MDNILNILFIFAIIMGFLYLIYFLMNMYDFYRIQKEHNSIITLRDKTSFLCAVLLLIYMVLNGPNLLGMLFFLTVLFSSFNFNFIIFSKNSMLLFGNKISYENIDSITIDGNENKSKRFFTITLKNRSKAFTYYLKNSDIEFMKTNFNNKNLEVSYKSL